MRILFMSLIFSWVISCQESEKKNNSPLEAPINPTKPLNAAFLIVDGVYNSELIAPMDVFQHTRFHTSNGIEVFTIAPKRDTITTFEGLKLIPDYEFEDAHPAIDILIVPSAQHSMDTDLENEKLLTFVNKNGKQALYTLSLCDGAFVLAEAKILDTYECTTFPGDIARFKKAYPQLKVHENVSFVHDRRAITSAGGAKSYDAALYMVELLYGKKVADGIAKGLVIEWNVANVKYIQTNR
ncbi:MAG: DJ-1/PfpI family protein [Bacteroidetes bacterium]|nr:DJ-1/PfpI family protein [Bacteroidota bacterium]